MKSRVLPLFNAIFSAFIPLLYQVAAWLIAYTDLHLFITAVSIPVLSYWGMPLSLLTIVGNFLFAPLCSLFLWLSAVIYLTELLWIPNQYLIDALDVVRRVWEYCLTFGSTGWLVAFRHYHIVLTILFTAVPFIFLWVFSSKRVIRMTTLSAWICVLYILNMINVHSHFTLKTERGEFHCLLHDTQLIVVDPGVLLKSAHPETFFSYHGGPALAKKTGSTVIDYYILFKPSIRSFQALEHAFEKVHIKNLIIPFWDGVASKKMWHHFFKLKKELLQHGCQLIRVGKYAKKIMIGKAALLIQPLETPLTIGTHSVLHYAVLLQEDGQQKLIYSFGQTAQMKKD